MSGPRVAVVLQPSPSACGAACLAMVLSAHGRETTVADCAELCGAGRDGASARDLVRAARAEGFEVEAFTTDAEGLRQAPLPAILHWEPHHFVVLERWTRRGARVVDPASGRRLVPVAELASKFQGVVLCPSPGEDFEPRVLERGLSRRSVVGTGLRSRGARRVVPQLLLASAIVAVLGLALPVFTRFVIDDVIRFQAGARVPLLAVGAAVVGLSLLVIGYLRNALLARLEARLDVQLMTDFFGHALSLDLPYFEVRARGDMLLRLASNTVIRQTLVSRTLAVALDAVLATTYLVLLLVLAPPFGLVVLGLAALLLAIFVLTARRVGGLVRSDAEAQGATQSYAVEVLNGIATVKAAAAEDHVLGTWAELYFAQLAAAMRRRRLLAVIDTVVTTLRTLAPLVLLLVGAAAVLDGTWTLGAMLAYTTMASLVLTPIWTLGALGQELQLVGTEIDRIADVFDAPPEQEGEHQAAPELTGDLSVRDLHFRYAANTPLVVDGISFDVRAGQKVAIVGPSGSGKTTLLKLLMALYRPTSGAVIYDGRDMREYDLTSVRRQFGVVPQEPFLFSRSIRENLQLGDREITHDRLVAAARDAGIDDEISRMPLGYETRVAEGGQALSGGQRQRIALARALVHQPKILFLDEATSHLDVDTERRIETTLSRLSCTRFVVAHRLSTIRDADVILVLSEGRIVERGRHDELLAQGGVYARLIGPQLEVDGESNVLPLATPELAGDVSA